MANEILVIVESLLLNFIILFVLMLFFQSKQRKVYTKPSTINVFLFFLVSIFVSIFQSFLLNNSMNYDLRQVPLIVGGLNLGPIPAIVLYFIFLIFHAAFGIDDGLIISFIIYGLQTIIITYIHKMFNGWNTKKKIVIAIFVSLLSSMGYTLIMYLFGHFVSVTVMLLYNFGCTIGTGIAIYMVEAEKIHLYLRGQATYAEKMIMVSEMSASITHEVRNPLTAVKGFLQLIGESDFNQQKRKEFVHIAIIELQRAEKIITDFLTFSKPHEMQKTPLALSQEVEYVAKVFQPMANSNSISVKIEIEQDVMIYGDRYRLHQCLFNFLKNSLEAMPSGGELSCILTRTGHEASILIADNGEGMTEEQIKRLGEPYYSTKGEKGTGLGMLVSFSVIKSFGGTIQIKSKKHEGTTIIISFPIIEEEGLV